MAKEMLINVSAGEECRIALLDNNRLQELYMERTSATSHVGNIYIGKVTNVEPSIQAAFIDFGIGRNGFLHISDLMPSYFGKKSEGYTEPVGRKLSRRDRPPIQQCLRKGDEIIVQIIKEGIGTKGPTLTTYLSIPGRVLVMMPGMSKMGISKKIEDEVERSKLRKILDGLKPPKDCGFIIRTAGIGKSKVEIERDLKYLARLWEQLKKKIEKEKAPVELYTEGDLVTRTVRDVFTNDIEAIIIDDAETAKKVKDFIKLAMPRTKNKVIAYEETLPLFHKYDIEGEIEKIYSRRVPLPSGGSLVIDQTEAIVAIDVNSGKFRDHSDAETTAYKTDMEAADEIPRQLKLRDMGGVIICDFIDLRFERHRRDVEQRLYENIKDDRAKTRMLRMSQFGIIEMTRQRMRPSLKKSIYQECTACGANGMVKTPESMSLDVMRKLRIALNDAAVVRVQLTVHPEVATYFLNRKRGELARLEDEILKRVTITSDATLPMDDMKFELYDSRDGYIFIAELGMALPSATQGHHRTPGGRHGSQPTHNRQNVKPKHDRRDEESEAIDAEELFSEDSDEVEKPVKAAPMKKLTKAAAAKLKAVEKAAAKVAAKAAKEAIANGEVVEEVDDEEGSVVDIDEGESELPGNAPDAFFDNNENSRDRNRDQGGGDSGRRRRRRRGRRGRGRDGDVEGDVGDEPRTQQQRPLSDAPQGRDRQDRPDRDRPERDRADRDRPAGDRPPQRRPHLGPVGTLHGKPAMTKPIPRNEPVRPSNESPDLGYEAPMPGDAIGDDDEPQPLDNGRDSGRDNNRDNEQGGGRRRRRRGGRGRGRGGQSGNNVAKPSFDRTGLPDDDELDREAAALEAARLSEIAARAQTSSMSNGNQRDDSDSRPEPAARPARSAVPIPDAHEPKEHAPRQHRPAAPKRIPPIPAVVKTGSADKHLVDDEPVDHEPVRQPRSSRDLDELPDFDD